MPLDALSKRKQAAQTGFARTAELGFRAIILRNRKLGAWAARLMGLDGVKAASYIDKLVEVSIASNREDIVFEKLLDDFDVNKVDITDRSLRRKMEEFLEVARAEVYKG